MKVSEEGFLSDFCCLYMEAYTRKPKKAISFDPTWRIEELSDFRPTMCIFTIEKSGIAVDQGWSSSRSGGAGKEPIPISFCPFCGTKIEFLESKEILDNKV